MYPTNYQQQRRQQQQQQQSMYGGNMPTSASTYHWDHQLRAVPSHHHDRITVSNHPPSNNNSNDSHWYTDSVIVPSSSVPTLSSHMKTEQQPATRAVIPSKRAAQNRAAQRAFRQRKERYVKDLEKKAKLMDEWKLELDQLRQQNKELIENTLRLEKQIHQQYHDDTKLLSPITSPSSPVIAAPVVILDSQKKRRTIKQEEQPHKIQTSFLPVNLRAPDQTGYHSPTTSCSSSSSSIGGLEDNNTSYYGGGHMSWSTSHHSDYDFISNSQQQQQGGQVLDDLCAVLSTRSRPNIHTTTSFSIQSNTYASIRHDDHNTIMMSRSY